MKSYLPLFDWNNGDEILPWDWLYEDSALPHNKKSIRVIRIRKK